MTTIVVGSGAAGGSPDPLLEFPARNDRDRVPPSVRETVATIEHVAAGTPSARELADWLQSTRMWALKHAGD